MEPVVEPVVEPVGFVFWITVLAIETEVGTARSLWISCSMKLRTNVSVVVEVLTVYAPSVDVSTVYDADDADCGVL